MFQLERAMLWPEGLSGRRCLFFWFLKLKKKKKYSTFLLPTVRLGKGQCFAKSL